MMKVETTACMNSKCFDCQPGGKSKTCLTYHPDTQMQVKSGTEEGGKKEGTQERKTDCLRSVK